MDLSKFYVVTAYTNPLGWTSRRDLYLKFREHMRRSGVKLVTVELALGDKPFEVIDVDDPLDRGVRTWDEIWQKEAMLNYGIYNVMPSDWEYVAWIDADIEFLDPQWAVKTVDLLQHYQWMQLFQTAADLGPQGEVMHVHNGFLYSYLQGMPYKGKAYSGWHPGYAWACRREAFFGLFEYGIAGAGDHHMALSLINRAEDSYPPNVSQSYKDLVLAWQELAQDIIRKDVGYLPGTIAHAYHGRKSDRRYTQRWSIIDEKNFCPNKDIRRDENGLWRFTGLNPKLRDNLRKYFRQRNEDSKEL